MDSALQRLRPNYRHTHTDTLAYKVQVEVLEYILTYLPSLESNFIAHANLRHFPYIEHQFPQFNTIKKIKENRK